LRGKEKVKVEFLMMCIAHNIGKIEGVMKRDGKNLKEILRKWMQGANQIGVNVKNIAISFKNEVLSGLCVKDVDFMCA
jgi:hypothetical protein